MSRKKPKKTRKEPPKPSVARARRKFEKSLARLREVAPREANRFERLARLLPLVGKSSPKA